MCCTSSVKYLESYMVFLPSCASGLKPGAPAMTHVHHIQNLKKGKSLSKFSNLKLLERMKNMFSTLEINKKGINCAYTKLCWKREWWLGISKFWNPKKSTAISMQTRKTSFDCVWNLLSKGCISWGTCRVCFSLSVRAFLKISFFVLFRLGNDLLTFKHRQQVGKS